MAIADKLNKMIQTKNDIKTALIEKGQEVLDTDTFDSYADKISAIGGYVRPSDWLELPEVVEGEQKVVGLYAVFPHDSNFSTVYASGAYTIDWGDGTIENYSSYTTAYHVYDYNNISPDTECSRGYRQVIFIITPQSGNLTTISFTNKHNQATSHNYINGLLHLRIVGQYISSISVTSTSDNAVWSKNLEIFEFVGINSIISYSYTFNACINLRKVLLNTSNGSYFGSMFYSCYSLQEIPQFNTSLGTDFTNMFYSCYSLSIMPLFDTSNGTGFMGMLSGCSSLREIPQFNTSKGTNFSSMFSGCRLIHTIPQLDTSSGTSFTGMFGSCYSLQTIPLFDTSKCTSFNSMFSYCYSLQTIPQFNTSGVTGFNSMFYDCQALQIMPQLDMSSSTNFTNMFYNCKSLSKANMVGTKVSISYINCRLSKQALVDIFNNLATVTGQTITITGNWGASLLTADDRLIATNKGWTITG